MSRDSRWDEENRRGAYLYQQGRYAEAEHAFRTALEAAEQFGPLDTRVATVLNNLASLCHQQRHLAEAQPLYERALTIRRHALGGEHPMVAQSLNNLSSLYRELGRQGEAEQLSQQAGAIAERSFGPEHWRITNCLNNLGAVYATQGRYGEAEACFQRTLSIRRRFFGETDPTVATTLCGLAELALAQAHYLAAEPPLSSGVDDSGSAVGSGAPERGGGPGEVGRAPAADRARDRSDRPGRESAAHPGQARTDRRRRSARRGLSDGHWQRLGTDAQTAWEVPTRGAAVRSARLPSCPEVLPCAIAPPIWRGTGEGRSCLRLSSLPEPQSLRYEGFAKKVMHMKKWAPLLALLMGVFLSARAAATPPSPDLPSTAPVEALVKSYVDKDFIAEELPPPAKCEQYSKKLMFAYDWAVVLTNIGPYDPVRKILPVEATIIVRCGPFHPSPRPSGEGDASDWPLRTETPIDFQMTVAPQNSQTWTVHEVTLWKSKQKVIEK
jgi:Tfp pilus assembly protein PilF